MPDEQRRRRRRRRRERGGRRTGERSQASGEAPDVAQAEGRPVPPAWQWRTFPVYFAFVSGAFLILLIAPRPRTDAYTILFFLFLGGTAFGLAHMVTRAFIARRRR